MLVTFMDLKNYNGAPYLNPNNEKQYTYLLEIAQEECLEYAGLELDVEGEVTEFFQEYGANKIQLKRRPILEVTGVTVNGGQVDFRYNDRTGYLSFKGTVSGEIEVTERLGFKDGKVPGIIKKSIAETVLYWAMKLNNNLVGVSSRNTDLGSESIEQYELPLSVKTALDRFRKTVVV